MLNTDIPCLPRGVRLPHDRIRDAWVLLAPERAITLDAVGHAILNEVDGARSFGDIWRRRADGRWTQLFRPDMPCAAHARKPRVH